MWMTSVPPLDMKNGGFSITSCPMFRIKSAASMVISGEIYKIYFDENVDLDLIKSNLLKKQEKYQNELNSISKRLSNKGFVDRAPKEIVEQEKTNYNNLENDIKKISLTIEGI
ncbi:MAG: hypothetical protein EBX05_08715 [Rhodobacteraceae bacterium]|nr:hypothetical protein [Paracoccaceae bacterium]